MSSTELHFSTFQPPFISPFQTSRRTCRERGEEKSVQFLVRVIFTKLFSLLVHQKSKKKNEVRNNYAQRAQEVRNIGYSCIFFFQCLRPRGVCTTSLHFFFLWTTCATMYAMWGIVRSTMCLFYLCFHPDGWHRTWVSRRCLH